MNSVLTSLIAYVAAASLLIITPGLDTALVLRTAAGGSPRRAALAAIGIVTGCLVWTLVVALGLGAQARPGNSGKLLNTTNDLLRNQLIRIGRPRMVNVQRWFTNRVPELDVAKRSFAMPKALLTFRRRSR